MHVKGTFMTQSFASRGLGSSETVQCHPCFATFRLASVSLAEAGGVCLNKRSRTTAQGKSKTGTLDRVLKPEKGALSWLVATKGHALPIIPHSFTEKSVEEPTNCKLCELCNQSRLTECSFRHSLGAAGVLSFVLSFEQSLPCWQSWCFLALA